MFQICEKMSAERSAQDKATGSEISESGDVNQGKDKSSPVEKSGNSGVLPTAEVRFLSLASPGLLLITPKYVAFLSHLSSDGSWGAAWDWAQLWRWGWFLIKHLDHHCTLLNILTIIVHSETSWPSLSTLKYSDHNFQLWKASDDEVALIVLKRPPVTEKRIEEIEVFAHNVYRQYNFHLQMTEEDEVAM